MDGIILTIDNKRIINIDKIYQILIRDAKIDVQVKQDSINNVIKKYIKDGYLDWKEKYRPLYINNYNCDNCRIPKRGLEYINITDKEIILCFACRLRTEKLARKIINIEGKISYSKFIKKYLFLDNILHVEDITKYISLVLFNLYAFNK
jgi:hypothetical protein